MYSKLYLLKLHYQTNLHPRTFIIGLFSMKRVTWPQSSSVNTFPCYLPLLFKCIFLCWCCWSCSQGSDQMSSVMEWFQGWHIFVGQPGSEHRPGFPRQKANGFFPLDFALLQKISSVANKSWWYLHVLFSKILFTNEHYFYDFWSVNAIARIFFKDM